jgi:hypothetical protein
MIECPGSDALVTITDALDWNAQEVLAHMHTCPDCRARLAAIAQTHDAYAPEAVPDYLMARIDDSIAKAARTEAAAAGKRAHAARGVEMVLAGATGAMIALTAGTSPANVAALAGTFVLFAMVPVVFRDA